MLSQFFNVANVIVFPKHASCRHFFLKKKFRYTKCTYQSIIAFGIGEKTTVIGWN